MAQLDLVIRNGRVIDGSGSAARTADVGISGGRIVAVGKISDSATATIDAKGQVVAPGFVDVHTHYDAQAFWDPSLSPSSLHGVTTVLAGNCGFSIAPLSGNADDSDYMMRMLSRVEGMPLQSLKEGVPWNWKSFGEYLGQLDNRLGLNAGFLVGHSALRRAVMGPRAVGQKATEADITAMCALLRRSLQEGGLGFSTSISTTHNDLEGNPVPSRAASDDELLRLAEVVSEFEGTFVEIVPELTVPFTDETYERMTAISLRAKRPLTWNVLVPASTIPHIAARQLGASDYARSRGAKVIALSPPKAPGLVLSLESGGVFDAFPGWADTMAQPVPKRKKSLADPAVRRALFESFGKGGALSAMADWANWRVLKTFTPQNQKFEGKLISDVATALKTTPFDALMDLAGSEDLRTLFAPPTLGNDPASWKMRADVWNDDRVVVGGSDAGAHLDMIDSFAFSSHMLAEGVRERKLVSLESAIHSLTDVPARAFGLRERGLLKEGYWADVVIFDPEQIGCGPLHNRNDLPGGAARLYADATGISHVIVNGVEIVADNRFLGRTPGRIFRSGRDTFTPH